MDRHYLTPDLYVERGERIPRKGSRGDRGDRWYIRGPGASGAPGKGWRTRQGAVTAARRLLLAGNPRVREIWARYHEHEEEE